MSVDFSRFFLSQNSCFSFFLTWQTFPELSFSLNLISGSFFGDFFLLRIFCDACQKRSHYPKSDDMQKDILSFSETQAGNGSGQVTIGCRQLCISCLAQFGLGWFRVQPMMLFLKRRFFKVKIWESSNAINRLVVTFCTKSS